MESSITFPVAIDEYVLTDIVGMGAYGQVYKAKHVPTGTVVAVKQIGLIDDDRARRRQMIMIYREIHVMKKLT